MKEYCFGKSSENEGKRIRLSCLTLDEYKSTDADFSNIDVSWKNIDKTLKHVMNYIENLKSEENNDFLKFLYYLQKFLVKNNLISKNSKNNNNVEPNNLSSHDKSNFSISGFPISVSSFMSTRIPEEEKSVSKITLHTTSFNSKHSLNCSQEDEDETFFLKSVMNSVISSKPFDQEVSLVSTAPPGLVQMQPLTQLCRSKLITPGEIQNLLIATDIPSKLKLFKLGSYEPYIIQDKNSKLLDGLVMDKMNIQKLISEYFQKMFKVNLEFDSNLVEISNGKSAVELSMKINGEIIFSQIGSRKKNVKIFLCSFAQIILCQSIFEKHIEVNANDIDQNLILFYKSVLQHVVENEYSKIKVKQILPQKEVEKNSYAEGIKKKDGDLIYYVAKIAESYTAQKEQMSVVAKIKTDPTKNISNILNEYFQKLFNISIKLKAGNDEASNLYVMEILVNGIGIIKAKAPLSKDQMKEKLCRCLLAELCPELKLRYDEAKKKQTFFFTK